MGNQGFAVFDTAIGRCGIAWREQLVVSAQLPVASEHAMRASLSRYAPGPATPPPQIRAAIEAIVALLAGEPRDLADIPLDMSHVPEFPRRVYVAARKISPGETLSYGELARKLGVPGAARAVGQALGRNPFAPIVPCHRVLAAGGKTGGFSAHGGRTTKLKMLAIECAAIGGQLPLGLNVKD
jgi:methylated-DNA-[protein]-cysteine S-methyltransferase